MIVNGKKTDPHLTIGPSDEVIILPIIAGRAGSYTTLNLIEDLVKEIGDLVPISQLWRGQLSYSRTSKFLGQGKHFLKHIKSRITNPNDPSYNPDYKFSIEKLQCFIESLKQKFGNKIMNCLNLIKKYKHKNVDLKDYSKQQWHYHNLSLKAHFFREIKSKEKAYWFGFLCADGNLNYIPKNNIDNKVRYQIRVELSEKDKDQLKRFCEAVGLDPNKIKERDREFLYKDEWKIYHMVYIQFTCKQMAEDLEKLGFASSKNERRNVPNLEKRDLLFAWLLGYYDGDGIQGKTDIVSGNREFLNDIKRIFGIKFDIRKDHDNDNVWSLTLGASLLNDIMRNYKYSLKRKRKIFDERPRNGVMDQLRVLISKEHLEKLVYEFPIYKLAEIYGVYKESFSKFIKEMGIKIPNRGYWSRKSF